MARRRRSQEQIEDLSSALVEVVGADAPMTVRQVFYQLVGRGMVEKTENGYHNTVVRLLSRMRLEGRIPWSWITDGTRWLHKSVRYGSVEEALETTRQHYRRDYWRELDDYVEVWLEKGAPAGVLYRGTPRRGGPLLVAGGVATLA